MLYYLLLWWSTCGFSFIGVHTVPLPFSQAGLPYMGVLTSSFEGINSDLCFCFLGQGVYGLGFITLNPKRFMELGLVLIVLSKCLY